MFMLSTFIVVAAILPIVAESISALVPVIAFAVKTEFAIFVIVAESPTKVVFVIAFAVSTEFAILVIVFIKLKSYIPPPSENQYLKMNIFTQQTLKL